MDEPATTKSSPARQYAIAALLLVIAVALAIVGLSPPTAPDLVAVPSGLANFDPSPSVSFSKQRIGDRGREPRITNVKVVDFDSDGQNEVLVCDAAQNSVLLYSRDDRGWQEQVLGSELSRPAHATVADVDSDGDPDVLVSILGGLYPASDDLIGQVVLLENASGEFKPRILLDDVRRVADVQASDLDGDGDVDLAVAVFGYARGEVYWLENRGDGRFRDHLIASRPGVIHVPIADYDGDGDLDIATVVSQDEEEVWAYENDGSGAFTARRLFFTTNFDAGAGGLVACDLDRDGDMDLLLPWGDNLEYGYTWPQPYHGCLWLENHGEWRFETHRIATFGGTYAAAPGDIDGDGDLDVALVSMSNDWSDTEHESVVWLENDGQQQFKTWEVDTSPIELITVGCGDVDGDGRDDIVAGGLRMHNAGDTRTQRVTLWTSEARSP